MPLIVCTDKGPWPQGEAPAPQADLLEPRVPLKMPLRLCLLSLSPCPGPSPI